MSYEEFFTTAEYDAELDKILALQALEHAAFLYHAVSKVIFVDEEEALSEEGYSRLCGYLFDNFSELPEKLKATIKLEDLVAETCTLTMPKEGEEFKPGVHYFVETKIYLEELEENMGTDFRLEIWEIG